MRFMVNSYSVSAAISNIEIGEVVRYRPDGLLFNNAEGLQGMLLKVTPLNRL